MEWGTTNESNGHEWLSRTDAVGTANQRESMRMQERGESEFGEWVLPVLPTPNSAHSIPRSPHFLLALIDVDSRLVCLVPYWGCGRGRTRDDGQTQVTPMESGGVGIDVDPEVQGFH
jgi:hypothetical protein